jgi:membrane fusion protein (multidrug efflux system)
VDFGAPPGIVVEATAAIAATSVRKLKAVGTLASNQSVMIRPEIAGRLTKIHFKNGAIVKAGTLLAELDKSVLQAEVARARASLDLAQKEHKRAAELLQRGTGTKQRKDETFAALRLSEADLALAQAQLDKLEIYAPFNGTLGIRRLDVGAYLGAGEDIVNLEQIDPVKINFEVPERFIGELQPGKEIQLRTDAYVGEIFQAWISVIDPQINPRTRAAQVQALANNRGGRLKPGQFVSVTLRVNERQGATFVPEQALVPNSEEPAVFRVEDGVARLVPVKTGIRVARHIEILFGVAPGEIIVTAGQQRLGDGAPVIPREPTYVPPSPPDEEIQIIQDE